MNFKTVCILITLLLVGACHPFFGDEPRKSGGFMTDQEMSQHFIENHHYFGQASEISLECDTAGVTDIDKKALEVQLGLLSITCYLWPLSNELRLIVYSESGDESLYYKGYFYSENPNYRERVWDGNLNNVPNTNNCHSYNRHIRVNNDEYYNNWYIFMAVQCD